MMPKEYVQKSEAIWTYLHHMTCIACSSFASHNLIRLYHVNCLGKNLHHPWQIQAQYESSNDLIFCRCATHFNAMPKHNQL